tara:strand:+ start:99 stop:242 length:144 start_codon:yes stop_codon:yes gene_type:complete
MQEGVKYAIVATFIALILLNIRPIVRFLKGTPPLKADNTVSGILKSK